MKTVIVIGDSIMSNVPGGLAKDHALSLLAQECDVMFKNISAGGNSLGYTDQTGYNNEQVLATLYRIGGSAMGYDGVIIQAGTNDFGRSVSAVDTGAALRRILGHCRQNGKKALVLEPIWRTGEDVLNSIGLNFAHYRSIINIVCAEFKDICRFATRTNTVLGANAGIPAYYVQSEMDAGFILHLSASGHRKYADWVKLEANAFGLF